jgi:hypothetical protein
MRSFMICTAHQIFGDQIMKNELREHIADVGDRCKQGFGGET